MNNGEIRSGVPIVGQMPVLNTSMVLTPALQAKLQAWMLRTGFPVQELGNMIYRLGLLALSYQIDSEQERLDDEEVHTLIPKTNPPHQPPDLAS